MPKVVSRIADPRADSKRSPTPRATGILIVPLGCDSYISQWHYASYASVNDLLEVDTYSQVIKTLERATG